MKTWELAALTDNGEVIDTTEVYANNRGEALEISRNIFLFQGLNHKMRLRLVKKINLD